MQQARVALKVAMLAISILMAPTGANAQQSAKVPRIGYLSADDSAPASHLVEAFRQGLRDLGYVEGQSITIEYRFAGGKYDRLPDLAAELVRRRVDVIMAFTLPATQAAKRATTGIPIVFAQVLDPIGAGLVASLARPGANVTGVSIMVEELGGKYMQLVKEVSPGVTRVAVLWEPAQPAGALQLRQIESAATSLGIQLQPLEVRDPNGFESAFSSATTNRAGAIIVLPSSLFNSHRHRLADLAARTRLPTVFLRREFVDAGGKPADLPVERPTKFELVINLKMAKTMGLTLSPSLLLRADLLME